jgi:hypothetical protein
MTDRISLTTREPTNRAEANLRIAELRALLDSLESSHPQYEEFDVEHDALSLMLSNGVFDYD